VLDLRGFCEQMKELFARSDDHLLVVGRDGLGMRLRRHDLRSTRHQSLTQPRRTRSRKVSPAERASEARHPNRLENKKSMLA
jgi:hypothetical protein